MFEVRQTLIFEEWLGKLSDKRAVRKILQRIVRLEEGLFGDVRPIGEGLSELRIDYGPGYRLYFAPAGPHTHPPAMRREQENSKQ